MSEEYSEENEEALTAEICNAILSSVSQNLNYGMQCVSRALGELFQMAGKSGYARLVNAMYDAADYSIYTPDVYGEYRRVVEAEDDQLSLADDLERALHDLFSQFQPYQCLSSPYVSGRLKVSSSDFSYLDETASYYAYTCSSAVNGEVDGTYSQYIAPAKKMQEELGYECASYFSRIREAIYSAQRVFEYGCNSTFSSMGQLRPMYEDWGPKWGSF